MTTKTSPRLDAFLEALPHAMPDEFVNAPGLGTLRAKFIRIGMEKGLLVVHSTGFGLAILQPTSHGVCQECAGRKNDICTHCACLMCWWFRQTDELTSPRVSRERWKGLVQRLKTFEIGSTTQTAAVPALDDEI